MSYSAESDIKLGNIPLPGYMDVDKELRDVADEIDSHIGFIYKTPVDMSDDGPVARPARLLLKRISSHLVTGRIVMTVAAAQQDDSTHAYGRRLVDEALAALKQISERQIVLDGALPIGGVQAEVFAGPLISNLDESSQVESFYSAFNPRNARAAGWYVG